MEGSESEFLKVIRLWAAVAWADGTLADAEAESLRRLIGGATSLSEADRAAAAGFLTARVELPEAYVTTMSVEARKGIYRAACRMAAIDRDVATAERSSLGKIRELLGIPVDAAAAIEADVPGMGAGMGGQQG